MTVLEGARAARRAADDTLFCYRVPTKHGSIRSNTNRNGKCQRIRPPLCSGPRMVAIPVAVVA
jgi:hypothetical protein